MIFPHLYQLLLVLTATLLYVSLIVEAGKGQSVLDTTLLRDAASSADSADSRIRKASIGSDSKLDELQKHHSEQNGEPIRRKDNYDSDKDTDLGRADPKLITKEPRQQFKIHFGPTKSHKSSFKSMVTKRSQQASNLQTSDATKFASNATANNSKVNLRAKSGKQMLGGETLKKLLLNQSLLAKGSNLQYSPGASGLNGTSESGGSGNLSGKAGSSFKFVFIQRATVAPSKGNSTKGESSTNSLSNQSLAASVSKQLASSLLYSAANLVGNLTGAPSLSALTNAVAIKSGASQSGNNFDLGIEDSNDIRRVQSAPTSTTKSTAAHAQPGSLYVSTPAYGRKQKPSKRPSKVYNLPVKFVTNGQPTGVVFNTIKQHFATIRKMQSGLTTASANSGANRKTTTFAGNKERRKQQQHMSDKKKGGIKGTNSRLIYLPLKYISNAKPDRLISPKAAHKSLSAMN